jgi:hypothetical protein
LFPWIGVTRRSADPYKVQSWVVRRFAGLVSYSYLTYYNQDEEIELARLEWKYLLVLSFWIVGCFGIGVGLEEVRVRSAPSGGTLVLRRQTYSRLFRSLRKRKLPQAAIRAEHDDEYAALTPGARFSRKNHFVVTQKPVLICRFY